METRRAFLVALDDSNDISRFDRIFCPTMMLITALNAVGIESPKTKLHQPFQRFVSHAPTRNDATAIIPTREISSHLFES